MDKWKENTRKYLECLEKLEKLYNWEKITYRQYKKAEKILSKQFSLNYWLLNPNLDNPLLKDIFTKMFFTYDISQKDGKVLHE